MGITIPVAAFGENLTVSGLAENDVCIGDIFRLGAALIQVSPPRQPCSTLAARYGHKDFARFLLPPGLQPGGKTVGYKPTLSIPGKFKIFFETCL